MRGVRWAAVVMVATVALGWLVASQAGSASPRELYLVLGRPLSGWLVTLVLCAMALVGALTSGRPQAPSSDAPSSGTAGPLAGLIALLVVASPVAALLHAQANPGYGGGYEVVVAPDGARFVVESDRRESARVRVYEAAGPGRWRQFFPQNGDEAYVGGGCSSSADEEAVTVRCADGPSQVAPRPGR